jgi:hypothetical protein
MALGSAEKEIETLTNKAGFKPCFCFKYDIIKVPTLIPMAVPMDVGTGNY